MKSLSVISLRLLFLRQRSVCSRWYFASQRVDFPRFVAKVRERWQRRMEKSERVHAREIKWQSVHARVCVLKWPGELKGQNGWQIKVQVRSGVGLILAWFYMHLWFTCDSDDLNLTVGVNEHPGYKRGMLQPMLYTKKKVPLQKWYAILVAAWTD